jgi:hypothetical protein
MVPKQMGVTRRSDEPRMIFFILIKTAGNKLDWVRV